MTAVEYDERAAALRREYEAGREFDPADRALMDAAEEARVVFWRAREVAEHDIAARNVRP